MFSNAIVIHESTGAICAIATYKTESEVRKAHTFVKVSCTGERITLSACTNYFV